MNVGTSDTLRAAILKCTPSRHDNSTSASQSLSHRSSWVRHLQLLLNIYAHVLAEHMEQVGRWHAKNLGTKRIQLKRVEFHKGDKSRITGGLGEQLGRSSGKENDRLQTGICGKI